MAKATGTEFDLDPAGPLSLERVAGLDEILKLVREREGVDLRAYRQKTIERRVISRLQKLRCRDFKEYATCLAEDPGESGRLLEHVTIKVSRFLRDSHVFDRLRDQVLPDLLQRVSPQRELHIWSAGCGNGEEAYSLSILLEEMERQGCPATRATIWGTDVDEAALASARRGVYPENSLAEMPPDLASTYFSRQPGRFAPQYELVASPRQRVKFLRHDLLSSTAPPDGLSFDLVLCRNVVIYFGRPAQEQVFRLLASSVSSGGYLCLGEAEQLPREYQSEFTIVDRQARLYRKTQRIGGLS